MSGRSLEDRVLDHIEERRGEWFLFSGGRGSKLLRKGDNDPLSNNRECPLDSMGLLCWGDERWSPDREMIVVMHTADDYRDGRCFDPALRARMLEKAGLTEVSGE